MTPMLSTQGEDGQRLAEMPARRLRMALREDTRQAHEALDALMSTFALDEPEGYARFLAVHEAILPPAELALERNGIANDLPDWPQRRRRAALSADLADLPQRPSTALLHPSFDFNTRETRLGAAYVLEGSRMGARMLVQQVPANDRRFPTRFLRHGEGERLWPAFIQMLDEADRAGVMHASVIKGATSMFDYYRRAAEALLTVEGMETVS